LFVLPETEYMKARRTKARFSPSIESPYNVKLNGISWHALAARALIENLNLEYPMGNTLFDQLNKTGLVNKNKANKIKRNKYKNKKQKSNSDTGEEQDEARALAQQSLADNAQRDRKLNQQQKEEAERKAIYAQVRQLIERHRVQDYDGDITYNFTDTNVVKHIYVSEQGVKLLMAGRLAVAKLGEGYELVPMAVADKIKQREPQSIIIADHSTESELDEDDPYADYTIPDDLMW